MSSPATTTTASRISPPLTLTTEGDTHVIVTRHFNAPPAVVYRAHTEPALLQKWLLGPDGWTMPVCLRALARRQDALRVGQCKGP